jgi:NAD(P)-dependent dehydrogenase (short-subunit alcohol dehydrogenase family)
MKEFRDKVAVITGGASGMGWAFAKRAGREGMKVVLADIQADALARAEKELQASGVQVLAVQTDVSKPEQVKNLADKTFETFGGTHLLFNNAGVGGGGTVWESTLADWQWVIGVDLWGVIYGIHYFVPRMIEQNEECHVINTASMAGLVSTPFMGPYNVSKHGVVTLSETMYKDLEMRNINHVGISVLCPGWVNTQINDSARNRPAELQNEDEPPPTPQQEAFQQFVRQVVQGGLDPEHVSDMVYDAIQTGKFYILTHQDMKGGIKNRMREIMDERNPSNPFKQG